jgi:hypothetical protein
LLHRLSEEFLLESQFLLVAIRTVDSPSVEDEAFIKQGTPPSCLHFGPGDWRESSIIMALICLTDKPSVTDEAYQLEKIGVVAEVREEAVIEVHGLKRR